MQFLKESTPVERARECVPVSDGLKVVANLCKIMIPLNKRCKELGLKYDKIKKQYVAA